MAKLIVLSLCVVAPTFLHRATGAGWLWETGNALGFAAVVLILYLNLERGRGPGYERHRALGWSAFALAAGHAVYFLVADPIAIEYLTFTAPLYMLAGLVSVVVLLGLALSSGRRARRVAFERHFRLEHWWLAVLVTATMLWHVAGSAFYLSGPIAAGGFVALCVAVAVAPRLSTPTPGSAGTTANALAHALAVTVLIVLLLGAPRNLG